MSLLSQICLDKKRHISEQKISVSEAEIMCRAGDAKPPRGFLKSIQHKINSGENALIAEIKKASPSKGLIRADFNPAKIASAYEKGGASCISVLTDIKYFQGADENIAIAKSACLLPALRKDFMLDTYQVYEARAFGADCILLIMAALEDKQAAELEEVAFSLGMDVLVEVHDEGEAERALSSLKSRLIGVNNRNLSTLKVDIATTARIARIIPEGYTIVCESGIASNAEIRKINESGVYAFLVGESLMLQEDIEAATRKLLYG